MSTNRSRRIDRDTAEQLLGGAKVGTEAGQASLTEHHAALAGLLAAVAAPAADGELPGEREAMAAFREARRNPAPQPRRTTMANTALARAFSAKALAAAFAVTALGGVAVAASTGNLPAVLGGGSDERAPAVTGPSHSATRSPSAADGSGAPGGRPSAEAGTGAPGTGRPTTAGTDHPVDPTAPSGTVADPGDPAGGADLATVCRILTARVNAGEKAHDILIDPSLQPLIKQAGGPDKVSGSCTAASTKTPDPGSGPTGHPSGKPSGDPTKADHGGPTGTATSPANGNGSGAGKG